MPPCTPPPIPVDGNAKSIEFPDPMTEIRPEKPARLAKMALISSAIVLMTSCDQKPDRVEITEQRQISTLESEFDFEVDVRKRMGLPAKPGAPNFKSVIPEHWKEGERSRDRLLNYAFGPENEGVIYLSALTPPPTAGDFMAMNLNRWRGQMGKEPLTEEEILTLPNILLFGLPAKKIVIDGEFTPMGATEPLPDYRMVGVILYSPKITFFVKMTGPKELVEKEETNFDQFTSNLEIIKEES